MLARELLRDDGCARPEAGRASPEDRPCSPLDRTFARGFVLVSTIIAAAIYFTLCYKR